MSINTRRSRGTGWQRQNSGAALIITLALLVLVTVAVVAFMTRSLTDQQINAGSNNGIGADDYMQGATNAVIAGLQKEMWDGAVGSAAAPTPPPPTVAGAPYLMTVANPAAVIPSVTRRSDLETNLPFSADPTKPYGQFANLVKQSALGVPFYKIPNGANYTTAPFITPNAVNSPTIPVASSVLTSSPSSDGRVYDGIYWNKPQLISISSTTKTAASDLAMLVPYWVYTDRTGKSIGTAFTGSQGTAFGSNTLSPNNVVGRYAFNVYDIGGTLNANLAGSDLDQSTAPVFSSSSTLASQVVPGYKGSVLAADLTALTFNKTLQYGGAAVQSPTWSNLPDWRSPGMIWPTDPTNNPFKGFGYFLPGGQYSGWLNDAFLPYDNAKAAVNASVPLLPNNRFNSRQDLITWVKSYLSSTGTGSTQPDYTWILPYLTHFSYDTDAPSIAPDPNRPKDSVGAMSGGNNVKDLYPSDDTVNPVFAKILDPNGLPIVKRRFPLSSLALLNNIYPGSPPSTDPDYQAKVLYDFGLKWDAAQNAWVYTDVDTGAAASGIKTLSDLVSPGPLRSPNFFELLRAAIVAGSLGKQWGETYDGDVNNALGAARWSDINNQIMQIGANIISQSTTNHYPTPIIYNGLPLYGEKDLPYLYRSRLLEAAIGSFTGKNMHQQSTSGSCVVGYSQLGVMTAQPELWNPHAPNAISSNTIPYPKLFRIVPTLKQGYIRSLNAQNQGESWETGGSNPWGYSVLYGDFQKAGGPDCYTNRVTYKGGSASPDAYIQVSDGSGNAAISIYNSFREPSPITSPTFPVGLTIKSAPVNLTQVTALGGGIYDGLPNTQVTVLSNTTPPGSGGTTSNTLMGFVLGFFCAGPLGGNLNHTQTLVQSYTKGFTMSVELQYSPDGTNFYPYDSMYSMYEPEGGEGFNIGIGSQQTEVGTRADPRTARWGNVASRIAAGGAGPWGPGTALYPKMTWAPTNDLTAGQGTISSPPTAPGWLSGLANGGQLGWTQTNVSPYNTASGMTASAGYYQDPDGVIRPADGAYAAPAHPPVLSATGARGLPQALAANGGSTNNRPVILNRPFQSVAELGYVFRDTPWRSLDFFNPQSGDSALLDAFCVYGLDPYSYAPLKYKPDTANSKNMDQFLSETGLIAGRVNLNTKQAPVLAALLKGASITTPTASGSLAGLDDGQATSIAQALVAWTSSPRGTFANQGPFRNPSELVGKYVSDVSQTGLKAIYSGFSNSLTNLLTDADAKVIKTKRECVMHALADSGTTRTWNLLIDVVAQTGRLPPSSGTDPTKFIVNGERHVWVSVAIDRITGKVIKMQAEPVRL